MTQALLTGLGTAAPPRLAQSDTAELALRFLGVNGRRAETIRRLYARSGVRERGSALAAVNAAGAVEQAFYTARNGDGGAPFGPTTRARLEEYALRAAPLAREAGERALRDAGCAPERVTHLVTVSCTGFVAPGVDAALVESLGLRRTVERTHVGFMGCHGALNGLRAASAFVRSDPEAVALVVAVELCSLHFQYGEAADTIVANALFADGAAGVVLESEAGKSRGREGMPPWRLAASGSCLVPDTADAMTWRIEDNGFVMTLSARTPDLIREHLRGWLTAWLDNQGVGLRDVRSWAIHPGGPRIVAAAAAALGLGDEAVRASLEVLERHGNMSSPTTLFILERLRERGAETPCVALGFGPGLAVESALFTSA